MQDSSHEPYVAELTTSMSPFPFLSSRSSRLTSYPSTMDLGLPSLTSRLECSRIVKKFLGFSLFSVVFVAFCGEPVYMPE